MRFRGSVAIDLGTVNTLVWVAGRGIVLEEPTAIAIDTGVGKIAAVGEAADALADKEPQDIQVIHPLRDGVIADLDATAAMLHAFLRRTRRFSLVRRDALVCVPSGATPVERRSIVAALSVRRPRYNVRLIDEPVAAAAGAGFDLTGGAGGFVVDIGGGTTEVAAVAGWRVVRSQSLRKAGNAMDEAIVHALRNELGLVISQRAARHLKMALGVTGGAEGFAEAVGLDVAHRTPRSEYVPGGLVAAALRITHRSRHGARDAVGDPGRAGRGRGPRQGPAGRRRLAAARPGQPDRDRGGHRHGPGRGPAPVRDPRRGRDPGAQGQGRSVRTRPTSVSRARTVLAPVLTPAAASI
jgi:MreB/Mrl family cell shape determining protein